MGLDDACWQDARDGWDAPFTPAGAASWDEHPALDDLFPVRVPGIKTNRAWVYSARPDVLRQRWRLLLAEPDPAAQSELLKATRDRTMTSRLAALPAGDRLPALAAETDVEPPLRRVLHRSFDRKWLIAGDVPLVGAGRFRPVPPAVWRYDVGGKPVLRQWFASRKRQPGGRITSPLDRIVADRWSRADTAELLEALRRLTDLAPVQAQLLDRVCTEPLITAEELPVAAVLPVSAQLP